ncbi:MAG: polysaccharide deacetylase family protein [Deltaproteobacteria bacterium]|nr:polysaccharide deacetylase family protein [Deltaproteobacteria bacterium]
MSAAPPASGHGTAFSFDIEDWFHSEFVPEAERRAAPESVVLAGTLRILDLLRACGSRSTFFLLGDVVREHPALLRRIVEDGHEVASHGMDHRPLWRLDADGFANQLDEFRRVVERVLGHFPVSGYRAPCFSLDRTTAWALDVLREQGYAYDSSIFPAWTKLYGVPDAPVGIYRPARENLAQHDPRGALVEFPVAVASAGLMRLPVAGGFYLRALPFALFRRVLAAIQRRRPVALYLHPRECAPESVRLPLRGIAWVITYRGLGGMPAKVEQLLQAMRSQPMRELLAAGGHLPTRA